MRHSHSCMGSWPPPPGSRLLRRRESWSGAGDSWGLCSRAVGTTTLCPWMSRDDISTTGYISVGNLNHISQGLPGRMHTCGVHSIKGIEDSWRWLPCKAIGLCLQIERVGLIFVSWSYASFGITLGSRIFRCGWCQNDHICRTYSYHDNDNNIS